MFRHFETGPRKQISRPPSTFTRPWIRESGAPFDPLFSSFSTLEPSCSFLPGDPFRTLYSRIEQYGIGGWVWKPLLKHIVLANTVLCWQLLDRGYAWSIMGGVPLARLWYKSRMHPFGFGAPPEALCAGDVFISRSCLSLYFFARYITTPDQFLALGVSYSSRSAAIFPCCL